MENCDGLQRYPSGKEPTSAPSEGAPLLDGAKVACESEKDKLSATQRRLYHLLSKADISCMARQYTTSIISEYLQPACNLSSKRSISRAQERRALRL